MVYTFPFPISRAGVPVRIPPPSFFTHPSSVRRELAGTACSPAPLDRMSPFTQHDRLCLGTSKVFCDGCHRTNLTGVDVSSPGEVRSISRGLRLLRFWLKPFGFDFLSTCAESLAVVPTST